MGLVNSPSLILKAMAMERGDEINYRRRLLCWTERLPWQRVACALVNEPVRSVMKAMKESKYSFSERCIKHHATERR